MFQGSRILSFACLASALLLSACGGAKDTLIASNGTGAVGTAPVDGYLTFAQLPGNQDFRSVIVRTVPSDQGASGWVGASIKYDAAAQTYDVSGSSLASEVFPRAGSTSPSVRDFYVGSGPAGNSGLSYTQFAAWTSTSVDHPGNYRAVIGVNTRDADIPKTGTATYRQTAIRGDIVEACGLGSCLYTIGNTKVALTADFATSILSTKIDLVGTPVAGGADVNFGSYTGSYQSSLRTGSLVRTDGTTLVNAGFGVEFFGPQASEYGLGFIVRGTNNNVDFGAAGISVGVKN